MKILACWSGISLCVLMINLILSISVSWFEILPLSKLWIHIDDHKGRESMIAIVYRRIIIKGKSSKNNSWNDGQRLVNIIFYILWQTLKLVTCVYTVVDPLDDCVNSFPIKTESLVHKRACWIEYVIDIGLS